jgi:hypothetical protein
MDLRNNVNSSLLILTGNYIKQLRTKPQRHKGTHKEIQGGPTSLGFLRADGSSAGAAHRSLGWCGCVLVAAAYEPGQRRSRHSGLDCLTGARARGESVLAWRLSMQLISDYEDLLLVNF